MTVLRIIVYGLIVVLVLTPFLGFAAGDVAVQIWNKHPRHAKAPSDDVPRITWKTTPGTVTSPPAVIVLVRVGPAYTQAPALAQSLITRPPFVPPRA